VYGLGTSVFSRAGIARLYALKIRSAEKALPVLIARIPAIFPSSRHRFPSQALNVIAWFLAGAANPGAAATPDIPREGGARPSRYWSPPADHDLTRRLIRAVGAPLASSSANLSGLPPAGDARGVLVSFPTGLAGVLEGGPAVGGVVSTVLDLTNPSRPIVLRAGAISTFALEDVLAQWVYTANSTD